MSLGRAERKPESASHSRSDTPIAALANRWWSSPNNRDSCGVEEQRRPRDRENRNGENETHQLRRPPPVLTRPPRAARDRASVRRWSSPAIMASRSVSLIVTQAVISSPVRPQPMHKADSGSRTQTLMQGVETVGTALT